MLGRAVRGTAPSLAALLVGFALALGQVQSGLAHAQLVSATPGPEAVLPASPPTLTLTFDSALASSGSGVVLYRSDRTTVGSYSPPPLPGKVPTLQTDLSPLSPGVYTVAWTSVSGADGHILKEFYAFTVGSVAAPTSAPSLPPLKVGDLNVALSVTRGDVGLMVFHAAVRDANGKPLTNLQRVIFRFQPVGLDLGLDELVAPAMASDAQTPVVTLGLAGAWQFQIIVRRAGLDDVTTTLQLDLSTAPGGSTPAVAPTTTSAPPTPVPTLAPTAAASPTTVLAPTTAASPTIAIEPTVAATATAAAISVAQPTATASQSAAAGTGATPVVPTPVQTTSSSPLPILPIVALVALAAAVGFLATRGRR
jgi:methionine-rich copper-binding protein CopC